jgi:hypothetical protein
MTGHQLYCSRSTVTPVPAHSPSANITVTISSSRVRLRDSPPVTASVPPVRVRQSRAVVAVLVTGLVSAPIAGCARGTTLPEAAGHLESDSRVVLTEGARKLGPPGARPRIAFEGRRPCADGRARQVLRGSVPLRRGPDPGVDLDDATDVSIGLARARGYRLERPPAFAHESRAFTMARDGSVVRMVVSLHGGHHSSMRIDAATSCLPPG